MSVYYSYTKSNVLIEQIIDEISNTPSLLPLYVGIRFDHPDQLQIKFSQSLSASEKSDLDSIVSNYSPDPLPSAKSLKVSEIDVKTETLISEGFQFDNETFSLSLEAQKNWLALKSLESMFTFPVEITTLDNKAYSLQQANLDSFVGLGIQTVQGHLNSGRALKEQVCNATTLSEIDNIVDNR